MPELKDLSISFLSLVESPATGKGLTLKSVKPGQRVAAFELVKADDDRMIAYGIVYSPDQEDSHGDFATANTIRRAAYEFMREARLKNIDTEHSFTTEMAFVAESWLVRKADALFPDEPEGSWAVGIQIGDIDLWKKLKSGELTGISLAGIARVEPDPDEINHPTFVGKTDDTPGWFQRFVKTLTKNNEESEMDKNEVRTIVREEVGQAVIDALKSAGIEGKPAPKTPPTDTPITSADVETAVAKAIDGVKSEFDDAIAKALAKGATETGPKDDEIEESFV